MDRKEFLKTCGCCAGVFAAASLVMPEALPAADTAKSEDWRMRFVKQRYAKLLEILSARLDDKAMSEVLIALGTACSSFGDEWIKKYRGDFDGFRKSIEQGVSGDKVTYDREKGVLTMDSGERTDCFCPLVSVAQHTPQKVCDCSLGWQQHTWETFFGKKVRVELKESVLRGGKRCLFEIHLSNTSLS